MDPAAHQRPPATSFQAQPPRRQQPHPPHHQRRALTPRGRHRPGFIV